MEYTKKQLFKIEKAKSKAKKLIKIIENLTALEKHYLSHKQLFAENPIYIRSGLEDGHKDYDNSLTCCNCTQILQDWDNEVMQDWIEVTEIDKHYCYKCFADILIKSKGLFDTVHGIQKNN